MNWNKLNDKNNKIDWILIFTGILLSLTAQIMNNETFTFFGLMFGLFVLGWVCSNFLKLGD
ncbi:MAG: hypothetical protein ISP01_05445 [Methanobrevibacter arboriphilus]|uniref:Transmembrane protein n=1 Tax=Methanobrevibacter arboriphilus TaxID=39441 RepID=A0A843AG07_METAZ|nr:hypothetical protein [Methanobrevibacter arboriphilus]MBF4468833.1 hypothetical protein [Methanobrevibacter arboriphilus]